jgi:hypothetical protein
VPIFDGPHVTRGPAPLGIGHLVDLLGERGDLASLRARADAGDLWAVEHLADLLGERGDVDELRVRADAGNN